VKSATHLPRVVKPKKVNVMYELLR